MKKATTVAKQNQIHLRKINEATSGKEQSWMCGWGWLEATYRVRDAINAV